jgi:hypothetical protein
MAFQRTILNGAALVGGPCFYTYCMSYMWKSLYDNFDYLQIEYSQNQIKSSVRKSMQLSLMRKIKSIFMKYLSRLLDSHYSEYKLNFETGHLFHIRDMINDSERDTKVSTCDCGLFSATLKTKNLTEYFLDLSFDGFHLILDNFDKILSFEKLQGETNDIHVIRNNEEKVRFIDCYESKVNALKIARDILSTIMHIGVFVHN